MSCRNPYKLENYLRNPLYSLLTVLVVILFSQQAQAGNIQLSNVTLLNQDTTTGVSFVQFDLSWENSWRYSAASDINNHDAAWVFVKFRVGGSDYTSASSASSTGTVVTVNTTAGLRVGMPVWVNSGTGAFAAGSVVRAILSATQFEVNLSPVTPLSAGAVVGASRIWEHAWLGNSADHIAGSGTSAQYETGLQTPGAAFDSAANPGMGVFIYRSGEGYGSFSISNAQLRWNYRLNQVGHDDVVEIRLFALEMVYVPEGTFFAGDGSSNTVRGQFRDAAANTPFQLLSEDSVTLGGTLAGQLANNNADGMTTPDDYNNSTTQGLPAGFPKGFAAFYSMKYEISQQQHVDFLNSLNRLQQNTRTATALDATTTSVTNRYVMSNSSSIAARNGIRCDGTVAAQLPIRFYCDLNGNGTGSEASDGQFIAANWLNWADVAAYLDWSALRPMTELEYEKAARGQREPVANAFAWSRTDITAADNITNGGQADEYSNTAAANAVFGNTAQVQGPLRTGSFAGDSTSRSESGGSLWGIMELSGNVYEQLVSTGQPFGRGFTGLHGNGALLNDTTDVTVYGNADVNAWPAAGTAGQGLRGGSWSDDANSLRVADRQRAADTAASRSNLAGGRGVRTAGCTAAAGTVLLSGDATLIAIDRSTYTASGAGSAYWWIVPNGWEIISGQGTATIEVYASQSGLLRVAAFNACGSGPETSLFITLAAE